VSNEVWLRLRSEKIYSGKARRPSAWMSKDDYSSTALTGASSSLAISDRHEALSLARSVGAGDMTVRRRTADRPARRQVLKPSRAEHQDVTMAHVSELPKDTSTADGFTGGLTDDNNLMADLEFEQMLTKASRRRPTGGHGWRSPVRWTTDHTPPTSTRRGLMLKNAVLTTFATAVLLSACSNSNDKADAGTTTAPTESASPVATTTTPAAPTYRVLDKSALEDALLTIKDFPTGYSQDAEPAAENRKTFCDYKEPAKEKVRVDRDFTKGAGMDVQAGAVILRQYENADAAKTAFDAMVNELKTCRKDTLQGSPATHSVTSAPDVGDDSIGVRTEVDGATALSNYALVGPTMVYTGTVSYLSGDADEAADLLVKQVDAYAAAAKG
jgi:hypothetical protein